MIKAKTTHSTVVVQVVKSAGQAIARSSISISKTTLF